MKPKYFFILLFSFYILNSTLSITSATVRFVSKTGSNTAPYINWQSASNSIQQCINVCSNGDTIYVANGVYKENLVLNTEISLIGSSMDSTVIDGTGLADFTVLYYASGSIENFNIYGRGEDILTSRVIYSYALTNEIEIKYCRISNAGAGIGMPGGDLTAKNLFIKYVANGINLFGEKENNISNCVIEVAMNNSKGISAGFAPGVTNYINNNIILFTGEDNSEAGISVDKPRKISMQNNLIAGFYENINIQIRIDSAIIQNNILLNSNSDYSIWSMNDDPIIEGNIIKDNDKGIYGWQVKSNYNLFWHNNLDYNNSNYGDSDMVADPMFVKDTSANSELDFDYHLQKYSPAIDRGNPDTKDVDGSRSDMGMFGGPLGEIYTYQDLAPKPPSNITAVYENKAVVLKWNKNTETDLSHYRIYRDTVTNFIYDISKKIGETTENSYQDQLPATNRGVNYYYKVTAYDKEMHQSAAGEEIKIIVTGLGEIPPKVAEDYKLMNNYPNPFNPSTKIPYRLKEGGYVKMMVYNILGEKVKVLVNGYQSKGYYEIDFNPTEVERKQAEEGFPGMETWQHSNYVSGIYLLRIEVIGDGNIPVYSETKKMLMIK